MSHAIKTLSTELEALQANQRTLQEAQAAAESKLSSVQARIDAGDTSDLASVAELRSQVQTLHESLSRVASSIEEKRTAIAHAEEGARVETAWARVVELARHDAELTTSVNSEMAILKEQFTKVAQMIVRNRDADEVERVELSHIRRSLGIDENSFYSERARRLASTGVVPVKMEDHGALWVAFNNVLQEEERRRRSARRHGLRAA